MEAIMRLDEPNLKIIPHDDPNPQYTFIQIESFAHSEIRGLSTLNKFTIHGTPEQLLEYADVIYKTWGKKEIELPQPTADEEGFEEMVRTHEAHKNNPEPKELQRTA